MDLCSSCGKELPAEFAFCPFCGAALPPTAVSSRERRKVVTVLFCDVIGSTALGERLDPESLRRVMAHYFEAMRLVIERHGGTVEKFVGDAVMAVFGVPVLHEDDAIRALRSVSEMREVLVGLNADLARDYGTTLELRIGVNSGEVVTGTDERLVTGDAVNVAARLEQAAQPGEILIGETTLLLSRDVVEAEPIEPLALKGKSEPVPAWRLVSISMEAAERRSDSPLVGREQELGTLVEAWDRVRGDRRCELVTVIGAAGVGKSRLVAEFLASLDAAVVRGRCLSYGEGITYWPVAEVLKQLEPRLPQLGLDLAVSKALRGLLANDGAASTDEIAWAFRKLLEAVAAAQPLIIVFDDIQWGEQAFLDLLEHVVFVSADASILLCCMARPDLLDLRPGWTGVLRLEPLAPDEAGKLIDARLVTRPLEPGVRDRIMAASGGNPLFVEELTAMLQASGNEAITIPPTIQALLSARLDQLDPAERTVLERAAVEGEIFHRSSVQSLTPAESQLTTRLTSLVRKDLIRPEKAQLPGEDAFRFRHLLIRDAAYGSLAKATRAELHERFSGWVDEHGRDLVGVDEIVGYHLEQAHRYLCELGPADAHTGLLAERAANRLSAAGRRANTRGDLRAVIALLGRAASLLDGEDPSRPPLLAELGIALAHAEELERAEGIVTEAVEAAGRAGDPQMRAHAMLAFLEVKWRRGGITAEIEEETSQTIQIFEQFGDERGLARAWHLMSRVHQDRFEMVARQGALERALMHARNAGDSQQEVWLRILLAQALQDGPAPLAEVSRYNEENLAWSRANHNPRMEASALVLGGTLRAMQGDFVEARHLVARGRALFEELGVKMAVVGCFFWSSEVEELGGDLAAAEAELRAGLEFCQETGDRLQLLDLAFGIARLADLQGHDDDAESLLAIYEETENDDRYVQVDGLCWRARVMARRGQTEEAVRLALEAVALAAPPDAPLYRGAWLIDAAAVLALAGHHDQATSIAEEALTLYENKGNLVMAGRVQEQLGELRRRSIADGGANAQPHP
jgi:class 3 adenylate cyclase/tetratricopeptide (TPR) repeat protein